MKLIYGFKRYQYGIGVFVSKDNATAYLLFWWVSLEFTQDIRKRQGMGNITFGKHLYKYKCKLCNNLMTTLEKEACGGICNECFVKTDSPSFLPNGGN